MPEVNEYVMSRWRNLALQHIRDEDLIAEYWAEINKAYSGSKRHYHNLQHIAALLKLSDNYSGELADKNVVDFAIFYHDYVYQVPGPQNEHKSALFAGLRLAQLHVPAEIIEQVTLYIEATKTHEPVRVTHPSDLWYFLDFDMAILGAPWEEYAVYLADIRKEYKWYPDVLYYPGRKSFLKQTLEKEHFYHTEVFRMELEKRARENMKRELETRE
jgi:predicted metal-dependent HD superfamily phosphohydrolase